MVLDRDKLKKILKEKGVKNLDDFNEFIRDVSKDVIETLLDEELTDHLGFEKHDQKAKVIDDSRYGYTPKTVKPLFFMDEGTSFRHNKQNRKIKRPCFFI
ncbi:MAG: transposase [Acidobacteriota bacterium]